MLLEIIRLTVTVLTGMKKLTKKLDFDSVIVVNEWSTREETFSGHSVHLESIMYIF